MYRYITNDCILHKKVLVLYRFNFVTKLFQKKFAEFIFAIRTFQKKILLNLLLPVCFFCAKVSSLKVYNGLVNVQHGIFDMQGSWNSTGLKITSASRTS